MFIKNIKYLIHLLKTEHIEYDVIVFAIIMFKICKFKFLAISLPISSLNSSHNSKLKAYNKYMQIKKKDIKNKHINYNIDLKS